MAATEATLLNTTSVPLTSAITYGRAVTALGAVPAAGAVIDGIAKMNGAIGERVTLAKVGIAICEAGAAIAANSLVEVDNLGRVIARNTGTTVGRLDSNSTAPTAAGQQCSVFLFPH